MRVLASEIDIAARTLWGEARGESYEGKKAVAHVLVNRWRTKSGQWSRDDTLASACLRHMQFSAWNEGDVNFPMLYQTGLHDPAFRDCLRAVTEALDEPDPTKGALHYHTMLSPGSAVWPPVWAQGHVPVATIGRHVFYNTVF